MEKNLKINIPDGYEIDEEKSSFSNIVFKLKPTISAHEKMLEIWRSCNVVKYSHDNCRTYCKDGLPMFRQDQKNKKLYYSYSIVKEFNQKFNMSEEGVNNLVISVLSLDLNCFSLAGRPGWKGREFFLLNS